MPVYLEQELQRGAPAYLRDRLGDGLTLARESLASVNLGAGRALTFVPEDLLGERLLKLDVGGKVKCQLATDWYISKTRAFLAGGPDRICVFENAMARPSDPGVGSFLSCTVIYGNDVYHVVCADEGSDQALLCAIGDAMNAWMSLGFMTRCPPGWNKGAKSFSLDDIKFMATHVEMITADAYDREGWLIWERG